MQTVVIC